MSKNLLVFLLVIISVHSYSQIIYVKHDANGLNNGTSWQNAYVDLSTAINSSSSGQIWVAQGVYTPTTDLNGQIPNDPRLNTFKLKSDIEIYGGFSGVENNLNQRNFLLYLTILSGDIGTLNNYTDNVTHVISNVEWNSLGANTILDGLIIKGGYAKNINQGVGGGFGGGIYINYANESVFKMKNCIVEDNFSEGYGGGAYIAFSNPIIENCIFRNNVAFSGGGLHLSRSNATIKDNQIQNNYAIGHALHWGEGGGIYVQFYSNPKIINNIISNNNALYKGGALYYTSNYELILNNNIISGNQSRDGGALYLGSTTYSFNNLIFNNHALWNGGGIYMDYDANRSQFINNTVVQNSASTSGGGIYIYQANPDIANSIFFNNTSPTGPQIRAYNNAGNWSPDFKYCNIQGGLTNLSTYGNSIVYENNIDSNPLFVDPINNNFRLQGSSPLINGGSNSQTIIPVAWSGVNGQIINFPTIDLGGNPRIVDNIDIGAYEFENSLGILSSSYKNEFSIYPNPSNGIFNFTSHQKYNSILVYDNQGKLIMKTKDSKNYIDISNFPSGLYFVTFLAENGNETFKLIKK